MNARSRRPWWRSYYPGWVVSGGGGGGGAATVQTDGVTIQGDGSGGNKIAIKAVQTDATLTGAGTVASPLSAAQQTPTGWPLPFYAPYTANSNSGAAAFANSANTLNIFGIYLPAAVQFSNIQILIGTADAVNNQDLGFYNAAGTRVAHIGAQTMAATGSRSFAVVGAPITLTPGLYFWATTSVGTTATLFMGNSTLMWGYSLNTNYSASVGGALPASITPPSKSLQNSFYPAFALH
jgi:hypothetical protein